ncbi:MAG TPA: protein-glutamate O-methyltransferase [Devosia sp.]|jgi:chemotaxis protein methyltransferase CheR|uniref:CheR family methyltransferase n=1 Tax=Devosia sp. TaxID=1871048 RepID=UPI002DDD7339|nr:protein-glutamate O-methyltransferase [Devosia sp.]HEV2518454.1 protein-glutamate O-methyltransferase [Devosia sp.]
MPNLALKTPPDDADDHLSALDFGRIAKLIEGEAGIKLPPGKRLMVEGRLRKRMRALGQPDFASYCNLLFKQGGLERELTHLINAVTTNKTDFFREAEHFDFLVAEMVPTLLKARERNPLLKIWSAASSTGAEAYTLAMVLDDLQAQRNDFRFAILGTDISTAVLAQGRRAVYPAEMIAPVPPELQARYVMHARRPGARREVRMVPELRRLVRFTHLNLMDLAYPFDRDVDVIFLRNVLIYFEKADQDAVVARLVDHLRPGGYIVLGHSESMIGTSLAVRQVAPAVFQKL